MASNNGFWKGVLQNALGSLLAGLVLITLGRAWVQARFDHLLGTVQGGLNQVAALQARMNQVERAPAKPAVVEKKHVHKKRHKQEGE